MSKLFKELVFLSALIGSTDTLMGVKIMNSNPDSKGIVQALYGFVQYEPSGNWGTGLKLKTPPIYSGKSITLPIYSQLESIKKSIKKGSTATLSFGLTYSQIYPDPIPDINACSPVFTVKHDTNMKKIDEIIIEFIQPKVGQYSCYVK